MIFSTSCLDVPDMIQMIRSHLNVPLSLISCLYLHFRSLCPSLPLLPPPTVCESLISALVAVQMALCWCFTIGLRSECLMPSAHSNFSTTAVSFLSFGVFIKWFPHERQGYSCLHGDIVAFVLGGSFKTTDEACRQTVTLQT